MKHNAAQRVVTDTTLNSRLREENDIDLTCKFFCKNVICAKFHYIQQPFQLVTDTYIEEGQQVGS